MSDHLIFLLTLVFTIIYTSAAVLAIVLAWRQVRSAVDISTKEKSLEAYVDFSEKYAALSRLSHEMDVRHHQKDRTLSDYDIKYFFNSFWVLQLEEWEFLQAGILPVRIFTQWMMHTHEYLHSPKTKAYFDAKGKDVRITAKEGFERYGLRVLRFHPDFVDFIRELEAVPHDPNLPNSTYAPLEALARKYKRNSDYWQ